MVIGPGVRVGPYEVTALIGEGGMGKVWRAHHTALKRDDALKVLPDAFASDPERVARFQREAQVLASLNHPNIAHVYGLEHANGTQAGDGVGRRTDPADRLASGALPVDEALIIARQIAEALEAAHGQRPGFLYSVVRLRKIPDADSQDAVYVPPEHSRLAIG
jgi:eukaryotic-like serine/threonine-protein kinase